MSRIVAGLMLVLAPRALAGGAWEEVGDPPDWPAAVLRQTGPSGQRAAGGGGHTIAPSGSAFNVPSPGVGTLMAIGLTGILARRRRR